MISRLTGWILCGCLAGFLIGLFEALVLFLTASQMFFDQRDLAITTAWTIAISAGAGIAIGALIGSAALIFKELKQRLFFLTRSIYTTGLLAAIFYLPTWFVLDLLTSGPQAGQIPGIDFIVYAISLFFSLCLGALVTWISNTPPSRAKLQYSLGGIGVILAITFYFVDLNVLVRLYPAFHYALSIITFVFFTSSLYLLLKPSPKGIFLRLTWVLLALALGLSGYSFHEVRGTQNSRFVIREKTAAVSDTLVLAKYLAPPKREEILDEIADLSEDVDEIASGRAIVRAGADLILLTVDAMRYDRLKVIGKKRSPAPNLDELAEKGVVFSRAYTPMPHTSYAISSLMTGKYTAPLFKIPGVPAAHETWPEILHRFRYETAGFYTRAVFFIDRNRFEPYIQSGLGFKHRHVDYRVPAHERADQLISFLEAEKKEDRPLFAWAHFFDPHEPYDPECTEFGSELENRYDCEIWKVDQAIGRILEYLDKEYPDAIIVATSDHGEEFGEHGGRFHGTTLYDEQVRVPIIFRIPGVGHRVVEEPVNLVDLLGTCLQILDIPVPARVRSKSLTQLIMGEDQPRMAFSEIHGQAMAVSEKHKLICDKDFDLCELYDLVNDPGERRSVSHIREDLTKKLKSKLRAWRRSHSRLELRPVSSQHGQDAKWPKALRLALGGDESSIPGLLEVVENEDRVEIVRKAAELLYDLWNEEKAPDFSAQQEDPETGSWLALLRLRTGDDDVLDTLSSFRKELPSSSPVWPKAVLAVYEGGDKSVWRRVVELAGNKDALLEDRLKAIMLLGQSGNKESTPFLLPLVADYQLTLEAAKALGRLGDKRALGTLLARLERERFAERKSVIIAALADIGDKRAAPAIAAELHRSNPPSGTVEALVRLRKASKKGVRIGSPKKDKTVVIYSGATASDLRPGLAHVERIVIWVSGSNSEDEIKIVCNDREVGSVSMKNRDHEIPIELELIKDDENNSPLSFLFIRDSGEIARIKAVVFVGS